MEQTRPPAPASLARPAVVYVVLFTAVGAWFPYAPVFYGSIGLPVESIGLLAALAAGVGMISAPIWGAVADRLGTVRLPLVIAGSWAALAAVAVGTSRDPAIVAGGVALLGVAFAGLGPMVDSRTVRLVGADRDRFGRARAWGSISFIVSALATGALLDRTGPQGLFLVFVPTLGLTGIAAYVLLAGVERRPSPEDHAGRPGLSVLRHRTLALFFVASILLWTNATAVYSFFSIHLVGLGANAQLIGIGWALSAIIEVPLMLAFPALGRRIGGERLLVLGAVAFALRAAAWSSTSDPILLVCLAPLGGIGFALYYVGTVTFVGRALPPGIQGTAQGLYSGTAFSLGTICGGAIGGQLAGALTIRGLFAVCAVGTAIAAVIIWWAIVPAHRWAGLGAPAEPVKAEAARRDAAGEETSPVA